MSEKKPTKDEIKVLPQRVAPPETKNVVVSLNFFHVMHENLLNFRKDTVKNKDCLKACIELLERCLIVLDREETLKREVQKH